MLAEALRRRVLLLTRLVTYPARVAAGGPWEVLVAPSDPHLACCLLRAFLAQWRALRPRSLANVHGAVLLDAVLSVSSTISAMWRTPAPNAEGLAF